MSDIKKLIYLFSLTSHNLASIGVPGFLSSLNQTFGV